MSWSVPPWHHDPVSFILSTEAALVGNPGSSESKVAARQKEVEALPLEQQRNLAREVAFRAATERNLRKYADGSAPPKELSEFFYASLSPEIADVVRAARGLRHSAYIQSHVSLLADPSVWAKREFWTRDEAVALSFGLEPELFAQITTRKNDAPRWRSAIARLETLRRATNFPGMPADQVRPRQFVDWANSNQIALPQDLIDAVKQFSGPAEGWPGALKRALAERDEARSECEQLRTALDARAEEPVSVPPSSDAEARIAELEAQLAAAAAEAGKKAAGVRERETLLSIIIAVAHEYYGYYPPPAKSTAAKDIDSATAALGVRRSDDTIRPLLAEAAQLVDATVWEERSKGS